MNWIYVLMAVALAYCGYQILRSEQVFRIRLRWIYSDRGMDPRYDEYTYGEMFNPSLSNWFGLKYPREKHFPFKSKGLFFLNKL